VLVWRRSVGAWIPGGFTGPLDAAVTSDSGRRGLAILQGRFAGEEGGEDCSGGLGGSAASDSDFSAVFSDDSFRHP